MATISLNVTRISNAHVTHVCTYALRANFAALSDDINLITIDEHIRHGGLSAYGVS